jgi:hypothetical protein
MSALAATAHPDDFPPAQKISVSFTFEATGPKRIFDKAFPFKRAKAGGSKG